MLSVAVPRRLLSIPNAEFQAQSCSLLRTILSNIDRVRRHNHVERMLIETVRVATCLAFYATV